MGPRRFKALNFLLADLDLTSLGIQHLEPNEAPISKVEKIHNPDYIRAVELGKPNYQFGLGTGDCPIFPNMGSTSRLIVGGALAALQFAHKTNGVAMSTMAGLHHAQRANASGFCYYNDCAVVLSEAVELGYERILYLDTDCHAGDGVARIFQENSNVFKLSIHESGQYLYPGCCFEDEIGTGGGRGYTANLPLSPRTDDASYYEAAKPVIDFAFETYKPQLVVWQCGMDAHYLDPITHLGISTFTSLRIANLVQGHIQKLNIPAVCLGGGGYHPVAVAKGWLVQFLTLAGISSIPEPSAEWNKFCTKNYPAVLVPDLIEEPHYFSVEIGEIVLQENMSTAHRLLGNLKQALGYSS